MTATNNIILFLSDDHGQWALGSYGNRVVRTPTLDFLAETGVLMENAFTPTPVCSPARACLLTGRLASQHGLHDYLITTDETNAAPWLADEVTLPQLLSAAGYQTALCGKWHLGADEQPAAGFDEWYALSGDYPSPHGGAIRYSINGEMRTIPGYKTQVITDFAIDFLRRRDESRPFFLLVGYIGTHSPWTGHPERLVEAYRQAPSLGVPDDTTYPFGRQNLEATLPSRLNPREALSQYYASVSHMDEGIGRILDELEALGLRESTLIVYTSDHGLCCGHHGIWGKGNGTLPLNMVEESIRVPLLFNQPGRLYGRQRRREFVDHLDLFQTLAEYAGLALPDQAEKRYPGRSFLPLLDNSRPIPDWRNVQFGEYGPLRMIRTETHKLVLRYPDGPSELFDLRSDPRETVNIIAEPDAQPIVARLTECLEAHFSAYEDPAKSGLLGPKLPAYNRTSAWQVKPSL